MRSRAVRRVQWRLENGPMLYQNFSKEQAILRRQLRQDVTELDQGAVQSGVLAAVRFMVEFRLTRQCEARPSRQRAFAACSSWAMNLEALKPS